MRRSTLLATLTTALILSLAPAVEARRHAHEHPGHHPASRAAAREGGDRKEKVRDRARKIRARLLREEVGLDEQKARQVEAILDRHAEQRHKLKAEQRAARERLQQLLEEDGDDQKAFADALARIRDNLRQLQVLRDKEVAELAAILTPKQQARLLRGLVRLQRRAREHHRE